ncbi:MAG: methyltransferase [Candidatus Acidiferrum sp.]
MEGCGFRNSLEVRARHMGETTLHEKMFALASAFWVPRSLQAIAELGIADALGELPQTTEQLARATGADPVSVDRVLRLLASHGIFESRNGTWAHTPESKLLRDDHPQSIRAWARLMGLPFVWQSWGHLEYALRTGKAAITKLDADGPFAYLAKHTDESGIFNAGMASKARRDIPAVLQAYDFSGFKRIADIGGGRGHLLLSILKRAPAATGILFDQPHVIAEVPQTEARLERHGGDFFHGSMPTADAYVLMDILHDWNNTDAAKILAAIRGASATGATILVIETVITDTPGPHLAKALDVNMLVMTGGRERTVEEHSILLAAAGFRLERVIPTTSPYSLVEATAN